MKVHVYRLSDPGEIASHEPVIRDAVLSNSGGRSLNPSFSLSPASGCIKYFDLGRIWKGSKKGRLPTSMEAVAAVVQEFFRKVNYSIERYRSQHKIPLAMLPHPFPTDALKHLTSYPMIDSAAGFPDHWISNWMLHLPAVEETVGEDRHPARSPAPVYGGTVEVRVGPMNQIVGLVSTIRLWSSAFVTAAYEHSNDRDATSERDEQGRPIPDIVFVSDSPAVRQPFLAPFVRNAGAPPHGLSLRPTCIYSLIIDIAMRTEAGGNSVTVFGLVVDEESELSPIVDSRVWRTTWSYGRVDDLFELALSQADSQELRLEQRGVYHVELSVEHISTGASQSTHRQVIVGGELDSDRGQIA